MKPFLAGHPPWRQILIISVALPLVIVLAVLAFAWPAARIAPRDLPIGIVGTSPAAQQAVATLTRSQPGGFDFHLYADEAAARGAIEDRDVYGAFVLTTNDLVVLEASAASPTVAQLLSTAGQQLAHGSAASPPPGAVPTPPMTVTTVDVVATAKADPHGLVLSSALLPLTICGVLVAAVVALLLGVKPAWRQLVAIGIVSATAGLGAYLIAQSFLGALPHQHVATWAALSLTLLAIAATTAGLIALIGPIGLGLGAAIMVFVGNPFAGATSAPELLPDPVHHLGQWLPPGAGANLLRSTAYFDGNGSAGHVAVLVLWAAFGLAAIVIGHHTTLGYRAGPDRQDRQAESTPSVERSGQHTSLSAAS